MRNHSLPHYLKTHRKRTGLSQPDLAYLLGNRDAAHVCRYEMFRETPGLRITLALCIIFQLPPEELFRGKYQKVERLIRKRAQRLAARLATQKPDKFTNRKLASLRKIISAIEDRP